MHSLWDILQLGLQNDGNISECENGRSVRQIVKKKKKCLRFCLHSFILNDPVLISEGQYPPMGHEAA